MTRFYVLRKGMQTILKSGKLRTLQEWSVETGRGVWFWRRAIYARKIACYKPNGIRGKTYLADRDVETFLGRCRIAAVGEKR